ncbi:hypothetical protein ACFL4T_10610 [candidate division KSB1 bacterium]
MIKYFIKNPVFYFLLVILIIPVKSNAQGLFFSTRVKTEYQYTDYLEYKYPDPIYFEYPDVQYTQLSPYISDFPEHRFLVRVIQNFDYRTALTLRYQYSDLDIGSRQNMYGMIFNRNLTDEFGITVGSQFTDVKGELSGWSYDLGCRYNFAGFTMINPSFSYYNNKDISSEGNKSSAYSFSMLIRQTLNEVTALQLKYLYFHSKGDISTFDSNTLVLWFSRYFYTETALHLSLRYHWNSEDIKSYAPGLEIVQYLNWASTLRLMYRYYRNGSGFENSTAAETDSFTSHSISAVIEYLVKKNLTLSAKYRFYTSNSDIKMNTYLLGLERLF